MGNLMRLSRFLGLTEFVVAFFVMASASSLPNLLVGLTAVAEGIPELSLGDIFGNNLISMTLAVAVAVFFSSGRQIDSGGETAQTTATVSILTAVLPLFLLGDGVLSRMDGLVLIGAFFVYAAWLFSKRERFSKVYNGMKNKTSVTTLTRSLKSVFSILFGVLLLILSAKGIAESAAFFAESLGLSLVLIGLLIVGLGNSLPEIYFSIISARKGDTDLILGNLMGSVIFLSTLVLGIVAFLSPIHVSGLPFYFVGRFFLVLSAVLFFFAAKSGKKIVAWEAWGLLVIYLTFVASSIYLGI